MLEKGLPGREPWANAEEQQGQAQPARVRIDQPVTNGGRNSELTVVGSFSVDQLAEQLKRRADLQTLRLDRTGCSKDKVAELSLKLPKLTIFASEAYGKDGIRNGEICKVADSRTQLQQKPALIDGPKIESRPTSNARSDAPARPGPTDVRARRETAATTDFIVQSAKPEELARLYFDRWESACARTGARSADSDKMESVANYVKSFALRDDGLYLGGPSRGDVHFRLSELLGDDLNSANNCRIWEAAINARLKNEGITVEFGPVHECCSVAPT